MTTTGASKANDKSQQHYHMKRLLRTMNEPDTCLVRPCTIYTRVSTYKGVFQLSIPSYVQNSELLGAGTDVSTKRLKKLPSYTFTYLPLLKKVLLENFVYHWSFKVV